MNSRVIRAVIAACLVLMSMAATALAHSELEESDPTAGSTITTPYKLTATFSEEFAIDPVRTFMKVVNADEVEVAAAVLNEDDTTSMSVDLPALDPGEYTVRWQTTTADDNGVERGTLTFRVAAPGASGSATAVPSAAPGASAAASTRPTPEQGGTPGQNAGSGGKDLLLALIVAAIAIGAVAIFVFTRMRRT